MKLRSLVASAGLMVTKDTIDVQHVRLAPGVPARLGRFASFIREAIKADPSQAGVAAARLVALDAVRPGSLDGIQADWAHLYCWRGFTHLEWWEEDPPRLERRALSRSTLLALQARSGSGTAGNGLESELKQYLAASAAYAGVRPKDRRVECERDALCWLYQCLPMPLFFHVSGLQPLSAVSRLCLAREQTEAIPVLTSEMLAEAVAGAHETCAEMLDLAALSEGSDQNTVVLQQASDRLKSAGAEPDAAALRRWVVELMELRFSALRAGPITSLLIAWVVDLCESGTIRSESPSKETPQKYFNKAAEPLLRKLRGFPDAIAEWQIERLDAAYRELIAEELAINPGGGSARTLASALSNFHAFLTEWFDVPPLRERLHDAVPLIPVRANVVWDRVFNLAYSWINVCTEDRRLQAALKIIFSIAKEAPARATELMFLRVRNVIEHPGYLEIEVAPSLKYGRLKTRAAQRRLRVYDPFSVALILSWVKERRAAGAGEGSLLFADPVDAAQVYRRHTLSALVTALLRAASGDPKSVGHDLRHSAVSHLNEPVLASSSITDINRLADNATVAGHVTGMTSLVHYTHVYEAALRLRLDAALLTLVKFNSTEAASLLGLNPEALRQRAHRSGSESDSFMWMLLREAGDLPTIAQARDAWAWTAPVQPRPLTSSGFTPTVAISRLMLSTLAARHGASEVANHFMLPTAQVEALADAAIAVTHEVIRYSWPGKYNVRVKLPVGLEDSLAIAKIDIGEAAARKYERLYRWLTAPQDATLLHAAYASWRDCRLGNYLSLDEATRALDLLLLLKQADVDPRALRVCYRTLDDGSPATPEALAAAELDFAVAFGMKPRTWQAAEREWDSSTYLQWDSDECIEKPHASSGSIRGLDAWMLVVGAHVKHFN